MAVDVLKGYVMTSFGQVHYRACGRRTPGTLPVVLLHQTASSSVMFERLMGELQNEYWLFAPDTPGFGGTDPLPQKASIEAYAACVRATLQRMEIERCFLFGHHSGASIAAEVASEHPALVEKLILSGPPFLTQQQIEKLVPSVCPVALDAEGAYMQAVWKRIRSKAADAPLELSHREAVLNLHAGVRYPEAYHAVFHHDLGARLQQIACPTLACAGAHDTIRKSLEPAFALLRHGQIRVFPKGGTYICDQEPQLVAQAIREFFTTGDDS